MTPLPTFQSSKRPEIPEYVIGAMLPSERAWVASSWKHGMRFGPRFCHLKPDAAFRIINPRVQSEMGRSDIWVASDAKHGTAFAFVACDGPVLLWAYTRNIYRRGGVCEQLIAHARPTHYGTRSRFDHVFKRLGLEPAEGMKK